MAADADWLTGTSKGEEEIKAASLTEDGEGSGPERTGE